MLQSLVPRLLRQFSHLQDPVLLVDVLEEAGDRIMRRQAAHGGLARPYGFAWVTARNVALSRLRAGRMQLVVRTVPAEEAAPHLAGLQATESTPDVIERAILLREAFAQLTRDEQRIVAWKQAGCSTDWIARQLGKSVTAVNTAFTRAKQRLRHALSGRGSSSVGDVRVPWSPDASLGADEGRHLTDPDAGTASAWPVRTLRPWLVDDDS